MSIDWKEMFGPGVRGPIKPTPGSVPPGVKPRKPFVAPKGVVVPTDTYGFLRNIENATHRPLLLMALEATRSSKAPVLEMGVGEGSSPFLRAYCAGERRPLRSFDGRAEWAERFGAELVDWGHDIPHREPEWSVALIDHAPEGRRHIDVRLLADRALIVVMHDSESDFYRYAEVLPLFKHRVDLRAERPYADSVAASNFVDVSQWKGVFPELGYVIG